MWSLGWSGRGGTQVELREVVEELKVDSFDYEGVVLNFLTPNERILKALGNKQSAVFKYQGIQVMDMTRSRILDVLIPRNPTLVFIGCYDSVDEAKSEIEIIYANHYISNLDILMNQTIKVVIIDTTKKERRELSSCEIIDFSATAITLHINRGKSKNRNRIHRGSYITPLPKTYPSSADHEWEEEWNLRNDTYNKPKHVVKYEAPAKKVLKRTEQTIILECSE